MIHPSHILVAAMVDLTHLRGAPPPTFSQLVDAFDNDYGYGTLLRCICNEETNPVTLLKVVAANVRRMGRICLSRSDEEDAKSVPFRNGFHADEYLMTPFNSCYECHAIVDGVYGGVFACSKSRHENHQSLFTIRGKDISSSVVKDISSSVVTDVEMLCVFVALVSLLSSRRESKHDKKWIIDVILKSLRKMKDIFSTQWKDWPFTAAPEGNEERDERSFDAMMGSDLTDGRQNNWVSLFRAKVVNNHSSSTRVYVGRPVLNLFEYVPHDVHDTLFGEKLASVLRFSYIYSVRDMPHVLASDTNPVIAKEFPAIIPSGCEIRDSAPMDSTDALTLVSRHPIPSSRRFGLYLLKRDGILENISQMGIAVAECMVDYSVQEKIANIECRESEKSCVARHVQKLITRRGWTENCGVCNDPLDLNPYFDSNGGKALYKFFRAHAFMDTFEAIDKTCSASLCRECVIQLVLCVYEKVTTRSGLALNDAFKCPCCDEYMINWLGRCNEFIRVCQLPTETQMEAALRQHLIIRMEQCFFTLEVLQCEFIETASEVFDFMPSEKRKFSINDSSCRPLVRRYKLTEGSNSRNRCALTCELCFSPFSCDRPDEQRDIETIDVSPPFTPYTTELGVEDVVYVYDDDITDEMIQYDDGPGTHKWPTRLSCGFIASNSNTATEDVITTCNAAVALLGRIPKKKIRGWNEASPEGKAIIALANWQRSGTPPTEMLDILKNVAVSCKLEDCLCYKTVNLEGFGVTFRGRRDGFEVTTVADIPLVAEFFKLKDSVIGTEGSLLKFADMFARNLVKEALLQMPECVYHRASGFVSKFSDETTFRRRPDVGAKTEAVINLNNQRKSWSTSSPSSYTPREDRTVEWFVEKGGKQIKMVNCFKCKTAAIKNGGCISLTCIKCDSVYCWLCEKPYDANHAFLEHRLLYCHDRMSKIHLEKFYNIEIAAMQRCAIRTTSNMNALTEVYIMENGYTFDVDKNQATKMKE